MATAPTTARVPMDEPVVERKVRVKVPRERDDAEDKVVWVNDTRYIIQRGVYVDVPESVALILQQEEKANELIYDFEQRVQK